MQGKTVEGIVLVPSFTLVVSWTQLGGGTCTERKRVQEAYGWVERHPSAAIQVIKCER